MDLPQSSAGIRTGIKANPDSRILKINKKSDHNQDTQSVSLSDEPDPGFDANVYMVNISFPVSDYCVI